MKKERRVERRGKERRRGKEMKGDERRAKERESTGEKSLNSCHMKLPLTKTMVAHDISSRTEAEINHEEVDRRGESPFPPS